MTNNPFFPSFMADVTNKQFMYINETEDLDVIIPRLADHGIQRFCPSYRRTHAHRCPFPNRQHRDPKKVHL
ncbi:MAG: hypothetical protein IPG51_05600 [Chloroflexi bacterium]|nr:hypothetical protein [Chloroflexota bacterium]